MQDLIDWLAAGVASISAAVAAVVWKKADGAVPKDDFKEFQKDTRRTMEKLFENAEADRKHMHDCVDRLEKQMHQIHVEFLRGRH